MNFQQPNKWQEVAALVAQYVVNLYEKVVSKALIPFPCPSSCTNFCPVCIFCPGNAKAQCLCTCCLPEVALVLTETSVPVVFTASLEQGYSCSQGSHPHCAHPHSSQQSSL